MELNVLLSDVVEMAHSVLRWMASNVAAETDAAGSLKPSNKKSTERIDGRAINVSDDT